MAIPQDSDSVELAIKKKNLQTFTWLLCCKKKTFKTLIQKNLGEQVANHGDLMEINFPSRLVNAHKENILMVIMPTVKVITWMTALLKRNLKRRHLLLSLRKQNKLPGERTRDLKRKTMIQRRNCDHKTTRLMKNYFSQQTLQLQHATKVGKVTGRFQIFC